MLSLFKRYEYDVAFSFGNDNLGIAESIAKAFKTLQVEYFLYTEHTPENAGRPLIDVTMEVYAGGLSKYVLEIRDENYAKSFWSRVEHLLAEKYGRNKKVYVIKLMLNKEAIDQDSKDVIYLTWNGNPHETAIEIAAKLASLERKRKKKLFVISLGLTISVVMGIAFFPYIENLLFFRTDGKDSIKGGKDIAMVTRPETTVIREPRNIQGKDITNDTKNTFPVMPKNLKNDDEIVISGIITDEKGILLDSVMVVLNSTITYSKSGYYRIVYHTKQFAAEYSIALSFQFSKPGYESKSSNLSWDINSANKEFELEKISLTKL